MNEKQVSSKEEYNKNWNLHKSLKQVELQELLAEVSNAAQITVHKFRLEPDGTMNMPFASSAITEIYGVTAEEIMKDFSPAWERIHHDDYPRILHAIEKSVRTMEVFSCEWRVQHPVKGEIWVSCRSIPKKDPDGVIAWYGYFHDITESKKTELDRIVHLKFFESMDRVNRAIQRADSLEQMMGDVLDSLLSIFDCDRAWLLYPCDPNAESWHVPMERTRPEYPGAFAAGKVIPRDPYIARNTEILLDSTGPVSFGEGMDYPFTGDVPKEFDIKSTLSMALHPKIGNPWMFGLHQCSYSRIWSGDDKRLFSEIGRRLSDGLTSLLVSRDLRESEERFRQAFEFAGIGMGILSIDGHWLRANHAICEMLGYTEEELLRVTYQELTHPDDLIRGQVDARRVINGEIPYMQIEKRYRHKDGHCLWARLTTSVVRSDNNEPLYFVSQIENIDQRKKSEQDNALMNFALNRVREGVYLMSEDAHFKYINNEACNVLGYSQDELLNMSVPDINPNYQLSQWHEHWRYLKKQGSVILETTNRTKAGKTIPVEVNANYFEYNNCGYNLSLVRDITERKRNQEALQQSEADLQLALDSAHLGDWKWDIVNDEIKWSSRCKSIYGLSDNSEITYDRFLDMVHPDDRENVDKTLNQALVTGNDYEMEKRIILPDRTVRWTIGRGRVIYSDKREPVLMAGITMDITERKLAEQAQLDAENALRESDERFRQMAENIGEVFWLTDVSKTQMLYVSPAYETIWGRTRESLYTESLNWLDVIHPDDRERVRHAVINQQARGEYDIEYRIIRPDDSVRYIHDRAFPITNDEGVVYRIAGIAQDITSRKEQEEHIQYLAYHDALTDLPNRALVMNRLEQAIAQAHRHKDILAVLFVDLDRFKTINDTLGHPAGDSLLQQAGKHLAEILRDEDTVGRVGGDEFLILLSGLTTPDDAAYVSNKIIESLSRPFNVAGHELHVTTSIGISIYPRDATDAGTLVKYSDNALYLAKEQGRNTFRFFSPEMDARIRARLHLENYLRGAIERKELKIHYQPLIDTNSGKFRAAEALLRWQHPEYGLVSPVDFIPIAEETGLIIPIGKWVLHTACTQARKWQDDGNQDFRVSVNLSQRQLEQPDLVQSIKQILSETGCEPHLLELEITESSTMNEPEQAIVKLQELHDMGIQLALDDFGTGYSNLAYLKRFPFDRLKIDRSFVSGIPEDNDDIAIVQATIVLARQLRLKIVAEGVETESQSIFLKANGCDEIQGYLFAKPMLPGDMEKFCGFKQKLKYKIC